MGSGELFESNDHQAPPGKGHNIKWRLVTNHQNMMFIISAGMIMPPSGFGKKYYEDTLSLLPGWIPLFPEKLFKSAIDHSISEQSLLRSCYAEVDLTAVSGPVKLLRSGRWENANFPDEVYGDEDLMLVPAPLPVSMIGEIVFSSKEDKSYCEKDAKNFANVPMADFKTKTAATPFKKTRGGSWPPPLDGAEERPVQLTLPDAFGGVVTLLSQLSRRDDAAIDLTRAFFQRSPGVEISNAFPMLMGAHALFYSIDETAEQPGATVALFKHLAESLVRYREGDGTGSPKDTIMRVLEESNANLEGQAKQASERLMVDLKRIVQFPDKTLDELLEAHQKPLPRSLILFFMNDHALDLLEVRNKLLTGYELSGAAILLGIADGWMRMPQSLRSSNNLNQIVPAYLSYLSHHISGSRFDLGPLPDPPRSLRELLKNAESDRKRNEAALFIARACKWSCIRTRIKLGKGEYRMLIDGSGASLELDGDVRAVESEVDLDIFMTLLSAENEIPEKVEHAARQMIMGK